jgi:hypothetical protein
MKKELTLTDIFDWFKKDKSKEHDWDKWRIVQRMNIFTIDKDVIVDGKPRQRTTGQSIIQEKQCKKCGFTETKVDKFVTV